MVVVMGVSGSGKSTVAMGIASALGIDFVDGDDLHSPVSVAKMAGGMPLDDEDRWPWLDRIGGRLCDAQRSPAGLVLACSALKRTYRDRLRAAAPGVRFVFLDGSPAIIHARMLERRDHFMPAGLLQSQFATLERPAADERDVAKVSIDVPVDEVAAAAVDALGL